MLYANNVEHNKQMVFCAFFIQPISDGHSLIVRWKEGHMANNKKQ